RGGRIGHALLAALHARAPQAAAAARRQPPARGAGGRAPGGPRAAGAHPDPHRGPARRADRGARAPGAARPGAGRAPRRLHRPGARLGGAVDLAPRPRRPDAVAARPLGRGRVGVLRQGAPRSRGRRRTRAYPTPRRRHGCVPLGRHRILGRPAPHPTGRRARQCRRGQRDGGRRRAALGDLDGERASRGDRDRGHDRGAGERPHAGDADRSGGPSKGTGATRVTHALHMLDPDPSPAWAPFAGIRPLSELRVGAALVRERWEAFVGAETTAIFALPHLAGFREPGVPAVVAVRPVEGPAVVGASAFAPRGLAPAFPAGDVRLAHAGRTVGWVVGPGSTWTRPTDAGPALEVAGLALRGVFDLVPALERLLAADLATRLADSDPIPRGSTLIGDPAWLALHETAVEPGVVFDTAAGPIVLESGVAVKS